MGKHILIDKGPKQSPATGYCERVSKRIKKKRAREISQALSRIYRQELSGARVLNNVDPSLNATLDRSQRLLARRGEEFADLRELADIAFESALREAGLEFKRL